jgi:hypothetical protein
MIKKYIKDFYPHPESNGYGIESAYRRFEILRPLHFDSVLDVGSGPCLLHKWLLTNNILASYEAVDIREESLNLCNCKTYIDIPTNKKYDLVCMFGTVTFNINHDVEKNKLLLHELVADSTKVCSKYIVMTVFNKSPSIVKKMCVGFSKNEIKNMFNNYTDDIDIQERNDLDKDEYFVVVKLPI